MATYTSHLNLKLPDYSDTADIKDLNDNFKKIDDAIASGGTGGGTGGGIVTETDPTVPSWAKQPSKPTYTAAEVGALPDTTVIPTVPSALPNPQPIVINGISYDGSERKEITVQAGDGGSITETDPTVPAWAKAEKKPSYTAEEVGALPSTYEPPVTSVNGKTGAVSLVASDVGALPSTTVIPTVPNALKNPYPLTINGIAYDGSEAKTVTIESTGGGASVELDTTLTQYGKAADAGAVGNALAQETAAREAAVNSLNEANATQDTRLTALEKAGGSGGATVIQSYGGGYKYSYIGCPFPAQNSYQSWPIAGVQYDAARNRVMCLVTDADKHVSATQYKLTLYALNPETSAIEEVAVLRDNTVDPVISVSDAFGSQRGFLIDNDTGIYYKYHFGDGKISRAAKSSDGGVTWEDITITETNSASILYAGGNGQIIKTSTGRIICGLFANGFAYTDDYFQTLTYYTSGKYGVDGVASGHEYEIIEYAPEKLIAIMRKTWQSRVGETWSGAQRVEPAAIAYSNDNGTTWTIPVESQTITNMSATNCCSFLLPDGRYELYVGTRYAAVEGELTAMYRYTASPDDIAADNFKFEGRMFYGVGDAALDGIANLAGCVDDRGVYHLFWNDQQVYGGNCRWHYMKIDPAGDNSSPAMTVPDNKEVQAYTAAAVDEKLESVKGEVKDIVNAGASWVTIWETTVEEVAASVESPRLNTFPVSLLEYLQNAKQVAITAIMPVSETQETYGSFGVNVWNGGGYAHCNWMYDGNYTLTGPTTSKTGFVYALLTRVGTSKFLIPIVYRTKSGSETIHLGGQKATMSSLIDSSTGIGSSRIYFRFNTSTEFPVGTKLKIEAL